MGANRSRTRPRASMGLGACLVVVLAVGVSLPVTLIAGVRPPLVRAAAIAAGSSCAHPYTSTFKPIKHGWLGGEQSHIQMGPFAERPWLVEWFVGSGYVVCNARIQLRNGSLVRPTRLMPYPTPTPTGGEYREPRNARSPLRGIVVTFAKSPIPPGASCNYPLESFNVSRGQGGDVKDFTVEEVGFDPNVPLGGVQHLRARVTLYDSRVVICPPVKIADTVITPEEANANPAKFGILHNYFVTVGPQGGLSSEVTLPAGDFTETAYARLAKP
jgi:hypothetical protein